MSEPILPVQHSIAAVERDTGLGKDTLRVWEKRYGFPQPGRDALGERLYPSDQVGKLRMIKRLLDRGYRPGKVIGMSVEELKALEDAEPGGRDHPETPARPELDVYLELCRSHQADELRHALSQALMRDGMRHFITDVIAPLNTVVGEYWARGVFAVFEEHLYTEVVQNILRNAISTIPYTRGLSVTRPKVLLTTFPKEAHALGLLMAETLIALEGARCTSLGVQTPVPDIAHAATAQGADIVALSFSAALNPRQVSEGLEDLLRILPPTAEVWAGGNNASLSRFRHPRVRVIGLEDVAAAVQDWRKRHSGQPAA